MYIPPSSNDVIHVTPLPMRACMCLWYLFTTFYCQRAGARVRNEDGFYSVKVEWLARRRWHMATKITTVIWLTTDTHTHIHAHTWLRMFFFAADGKISTLSLQRIMMIARLCFVIAFVREKRSKKLFASRNFMNLIIMPWKSLPDFPFLVSIMLSLLPSVSSTQRLRLRTFTASEWASRRRFFLLQRWLDFDSSAGMKTKTFPMNHQQQASSRSSCWCGFWRTFFSTKFHLIINPMNSLETPCNDVAFLSKAFWVVNI